MAGSFTDAGENLVLDKFFTSTALYTSLYVGLSTSTVTDSGSTSISEPSTVGAYGRVEVANSTANWGVASGGAIANTAAISFAEATGDWGTVTYFFIATSSTGTTILGYGDLGTAKAVTTGDTVSFAVGDLDITVS